MFSQKQTNFQFGIKEKYKQFINNDFEKTASKKPQIGTKKQEKAYYL